MSSKNSNTDIIANPPGRIGIVLDVLDSTQETEG